MNNTTQFQFAANHVESAAEKILEKYLAEVEAYCGWQKVKDPVTLEERDPDEKFMRDIEFYSEIADSVKKAFREQVLIRIKAAKRGMKSFGLHTNPELRHAILRYTMGGIWDVFDQREYVKRVEEKLDKAKGQLTTGDIDKFIADITAILEDVKNKRGDAK
jgi:serine protein kinase